MVRIQCCEGKKTLIFCMCHLSCGIVAGSEEDKVQEMIERSKESEVSPENCLLRASATRLVLPSL
jgi:hypothetical protein